MILDFRPCSICGRDSRSNIRIKKNESVWRCGYHDKILNGELYK